MSSDPPQTQEALTITLLCGAVGKCQTFVSSACAWSCVILITTLWDRSYHYLRFPDEETEAQRLAESHTFMVELRLERAAPDLMLSTTMLESLFLWFSFLLTHPEKSQGQSPHKPIAGVTLMGAEPSPHLRDAAMWAVRGTQIHAVHLCASASQILQSMSTAVPETDWKCWSWPPEPWRTNS